MPHQPVPAPLDQHPQDAQHAEDEHRDHDPGKHGRQSSERVDAEGRRSSRRDAPGDEVRRQGAPRRPSHVHSPPSRTAEVEVGHELTDDEVREVAGKEVKKRTESIEAFDAAGRDELAAKEREERDIVSVYAPAQLSEDAVDALIDEALAATGATSPKEMGKVMGFVMGKAKGQADGTVVQQKVLARLTGP